MKGTGLSDILLRVQNRSRQLTEEQLIGLVMASVALGGACWQGSVMMLKNTGICVRDPVLKSLQHYLKNVYHSQLAKWICTYWEVVD